MNAIDAAGAHRRTGPDSRRPHGPAPTVLSGRVTGGYVVKQLVADGLLSASDAERFNQSGGRERAGHPLAVLAEMNYRSPQADRRLLDLETLTQWLAGKAGLPYFHIDPLRVDLGQTRHGVATLGRGKCQKGKRLQTDVLIARILRP